MRRFGDLEMNQKKDLDDRCHVPGGWVYMMSMNGGRAVHSVFVPETRSGR